MRVKELKSTLNSDFSTLIERRGTNCEKWDGLAQVYGRDDLLPLWVADMDLPSPPEVTAAVRERAEHPVYGYTFRPDIYRPRRSGSNSNPGVSAVFSGGNQKWSEPY